MDEDKLLESLIVDDFTPLLTALKQSDEEEDEDRQ